MIGWYLKVIGVFDFYEGLVVCFMGYGVFDFKGKFGVVFFSNEVGVEEGFVVSGGRYIV